LEILRPECGDLLSEGTIFYIIRKVEASTSELSHRNRAKSKIIGERSHSYSGI